MPGRGRKRSTTALIALCCGTLAFLAAYAALDMASAQQLIDILSGLVGLVSASYGLIRWQSRSPSRISDQRLTQAADDLARSVHVTWGDEAAKRHLGTPIPLRWQRTGGDVPGHPGRPGRRPLSSWPMSTAGAQRSGTQNDLLAMYSQYSAGPILLLGNAGAGKTATAILLLVRALDSRMDKDEAARARIPVPVLFSPHDWNPVLEPAVEEWLARRTCETYPAVAAYGRETVRALINEGRVSLILDGLDEMPAAARATAVQALNDLAAPIRLVVASRESALEEIADQTHLQRAVTLELQPVSPGAAERYLRNWVGSPPQPPWERLIAGLRGAAGMPLAQALNNPLMLTILTDTYDRAGRCRAGQGAPAGQVDELLDTGRFAGREDIEDHLLALLIPTRYAGSDRNPRDPAPPCISEQAMTWLAHIARRLAGPTAGDQADAGDPAGARAPERTHDLTWWTIPRWLPAWPRAVATTVVVTLCVGVGLDLPDALITTLAAPFASHPRAVLLSSVPAIVLTSGTPFGASPANFATNVAAVAVIVAFGLIRVGRPPKRLGRPAWRRALSPWSMVFGLCFALLVGFGFQEHSFNVGYGLAAGFDALLAVALVNALTAQDNASAPDSPVSPASWWRSERRYGLTIGLLGGTATGIGVGVYLAHHFHFAKLGLALLLAAILVWTASGAVIGLTCSQTWHMHLTALQLSISRECPARLMRFLEDAREREVLRTAGGAYQFRHARLEALLAVAPPGRAGTAAQTVGVQPIR